MNIGKTVLDLRKSHNIKQVDLADALGVTSTYMCLIEKNKAKPSLEMIVLMAKYFDYTPTEFIIKASGKSLDGRDDIIAASALIINPLIKYLTS